MEKATLEDYVKLAQKWRASWLKYYNNRIRYDIVKWLPASK